LLLDLKCRKAFVNYWRESLMIKIIVGIVVAFAVLLGLSGFWYTVPQGEEAIVLDWGRALQEQGPGLQWKNPISQSVVSIDTRQQHLSWDRSHNTYSADTQQADVRLEVLWHVDAGHAMDILNRFHDVAGLQEKAVAPVALGQFKDTFGGYTAQQITQNRADVATKTAKNIQAALSGVPVIIDSVQLTDIKFKPEYEQAVEQKVQREQELQREQVSNQIAVNKAAAERDAAKARADGEAYARTTQAKAEAESEKMKGEAQAQAETADQGPG
jgi:regulator of protease activity HflC (stomatin/prohibitin superfamily)